MMVDPDICRRLLALETLPEKLRTVFREHRQRTFWVVVFGSFAGYFLAMAVVDLARRAA